jgi:hypothetical protein
MIWFWLLSPEVANNDQLTGSTHFALGANSAAGGCSYRQPIDSHTHMHHVTEPQHL